MITPVDNSSACHRLLSVGSSMIRLRHFLTPMPPDHVTGEQGAAVETALTAGHRSDLQPALATLVAALGLTAGWLTVRSECLCSKKVGEQGGADPSARAAVR